MPKINKDIDVPVSGNKKSAEELNELDILDSAEEVEAPVNPRDIAMQSVVKMAVGVREQQYIDEGMEIPGGGEAEELELPEDLKMLEDEEIVDNPVEIADTPIVSPEAKQVITIKVDGVEKEISLDAAAVIIQKNENADAKLGQANKILNQARQIQQTHASTPPDDSKRPVVDETALNGALNKLYDGDVAEASKEISKIISDNRPAPVDVTSQVATEVARITNHNDLKDSVKRFKSNEDFKQLAKDPKLMQMVDDFTVELRQDQEFMATNPSFDDFLKEAGNKTKAWVSSFAPDVSPTKEITEERRNRKLEKAPAINSRTARRAAPVAKPAATREDNLAGMAKARGQTLYNK